MRDCITCDPRHCHIASLTRRPCASLSPTTTKVGKFAISWSITTLLESCSYK